MDQKKLITIIRKIVSEEVKKTVVPIVTSAIKESVLPSIKKHVKTQVKNIVNEVLSEKLMGLLIEQKNSPNNLANNFNVENPEERGIKKFVAQQKQAEPDRAQLREQLMKRLGVEDNPMAQLIYDIDDEPPPPQHYAVTTGTRLPSGEYIDSDDEGVDLSNFGL